MKKSKTLTLTFTCPGCKETFEFDNVGEYEFVPCPICGANNMTIKKGQTLLLQAFSFTQTGPIENPAIIV
jgi:Zn finger protein HypA/HybF involved in hydrogenase expression